MTKVLKGKSPFGRLSDLPAHLSLKAKADFFNTSIKKCKRKEKIEDLEKEIKHISDCGDRKQEQIDKFLEIANEKGLNDEMIKSFEKVLEED